MPKWRQSGAPACYGGRSVGPAYDGPMSRGTGWAATVLLGLGALTACGSPVADPAAGTGPLTAPALAWLVDQHVESEAGSAEPTWDTRLMGADAIGADVRFGPGEGEDGDLVRAVVAPADSPGRSFRRLLGCRPRQGSRSHCAETDGVTLRWETEVPEEDPGHVEVLRMDEHTAVLVLYAGPVVTGDPRERALPIPVDDLVALATDPRVAMTTSGQAAVAGAHFEVYDDPSTPGRDVADPELTQPATPATLALVADDHVGWDFAEARPDRAVGAPGQGIVVDFPAQSGWRAVSLRGSVVPGPEREAQAGTRRFLGCGLADGCGRAGPGDGCDWPGSARVAWRLADGDDPGEIRAATWAGGALRTVAWTGDEVTQDPRGRDAQVLVEEVACLLLDPRSAP